MIKFCSDVDYTLRPFRNRRGGRKCSQGIGRPNQEEDRAVDGKDVMTDGVAETMSVGEEREGGREEGEANR
jgi:hypothetical protein